ncbi:hypothetical protein [Rubrivivax albus]|uniref:Uncharacterized protein n=1 Tax=Rubrivivax albus TaxID=2499835 RepID=A0A437JKN0_9BURK|nr:hypothetical protein [Rubrivivax albus]RVT47216.1 hypothetical protein ENE75_24350 [Rubrivivax albus]
MTFSQLDSNLEVYLRNTELAERVSPEGANPKLRSFKQKLDVLEERLKGMNLGYPKEAAELRIWLDKAEQLRGIRNELVHGRWGLEARQGFVVNILGLPGSESQKVKSYTLDGLGELVAFTYEVSTTFWQLRRRLP